MEDLQSRVQDYNEMIKDRDEEIKRLRLDNQELQEKYKASCSRETVLKKRVAALEKKCERLQVCHH